MAGSLLGAKFGYSQIHKHLINGLIRKEYLEVKFNTFLACIQNRKSNSKI
jgi:ADP-ribosylglycohydrolase